MCSNGTRRKGTALEPTTHPDLVALGHVLRARMDRTLDAEMEAARAAAQRRRNLRDRLLTVEDAGDLVLVATVDGVVHGGKIVAVGTDHVVVEVGDRARVLAIQHITTLEVCG